MNAVAPPVMAQAISAEIAPVRRYCEMTAELLQKVYHVISIPPRTQAHNMGYRYVAIPDDELAHYVANGAELVP